MARDLGYLAAEAPALVALGIAALYRGDHDGAIRADPAAASDPGGRPGAIAAPGSTILIPALIETGDLAAAESACAAALAQCRDAGDMTKLASLLSLMADLDMQAGRFQDAAAHLREGLQVAMRTGDLWETGNGLWSCGLAMRRDRALRRGGHAMGRPRRPFPAAGDRRRDARGCAQTAGSAEQDPAGAGTGPVPGGRRARRGDEPGHRGRVRPDAHRPRRGRSAGESRDWHGSAPGNGSWSPWSRRAAPTRRSPRSCTSASAPSARTWTGSGTRPAAAAAPT